MLTLHITTHSPRLEQFVLSLAVTTCLLAIMAAAIYLMFFFFENKPLDEFLGEQTITILLFPLFTALVHTFSSRQHVLTMTGIKAPNAVADWAIALLQQEGLEILGNFDQETVLAPSTRKSRLFNYWLGSELTRISHTGTEVTISGRYRHLESIESMVRLGKSVIK